VRIGPTAWPFTGFIHTYIHTDRQLDKYILDCHTADSKPVKQEVNSTVILPPLVFPGSILTTDSTGRGGQRRKVNAFDSGKT
jgi:hypothetical protein